MNIASIISMKALALAFIDIDVVFDDILNLLENLNHPCDIGVLFLMITSAKMSSFFYPFNKLSISKYLCLAAESQEPDLTFHLSTRKLLC